MDNPKKTEEAMKNGQSRENRRGEVDLKLPMAMSE
jgi:hypothetical protein